ncbi:MAG TPA: R3H domain-containing nucleic acid-binding protein [Chloroflexia bacterium]|nr:R3H domain-containing nucleic acid-binding protein [Chloroflexia bacterium]
MRHVDIQALSVEEAVRLALEQLGRTRDQVKVEVLATDPGGDEVLVRVTTIDQADGQTRGGHPQEEISPRGRKPFGSSGGGAGSGTRPSGFGRRDGNRGQGQANRTDRGNRADYMERPPRSASNDQYERPPRGNRAEEMPVAEGDFDEDDNRGNRIEGAAGQGVRAPFTGVTLDESLLPGAVAEGEAATPKDAIAPMAAEILQTILNGMRVHAKIVRREPAEEGEAAFPDDSDALVLNVTGLNEREQNNLVGRRGETLEAIQFLLNLVLGRKADLWARVTVDIEGYRLRRKMALINLARRTAEQVQTRKQAIPLEAMSPYERRIIHMTLADSPTVITESTGAEPERRVVILPRQDEPGESGES